MKYRFNNPITNTFELFSTREEAEARLSVVKTEYIEQESYRFTVAKEIVEGNNTIWTTANLDTDAEDYIYQVFNQNTGLHEKVDTLSAARARNKELKDAFLDSVFSARITEYEEPELIPSIPSTTV